MFLFWTVICTLVCFYFHLGKRASAGFQGQLLSNICLNGLFPLELIYTSVVFQTQLSNHGKIRAPTYRWEGKHQENRRFFHLAFLIFIPDVFVEIEWDESFQSKAISHYWGGRAVEGVHYWEVLSSIGCLPAGSEAVRSSVVAFYAGFGILLPVLVYLLS